MQKIGVFLTVVCGLMASVSALALQFDVEVSASLKQQVVEDLRFMASIQGATATELHQRIFGGVDGKNYLNWFQKRVLTAGVDDCGSPNAVACVRPVYANKIWFTQNYTKFSHPQISRLAVIYHEARHTERENGNWSHADCPVPFKDARGEDMRSIWTGAVLAGQPACDVTAFGSYGSQSILLKNIALKCKSCNEKVRADADLYGMDQLNRITQPQVKAEMRQDFGI